MRLDAHTHIGPYPGEKTLDELLGMMDKFEMDMALAYPGRGLTGTPTVIAECNDYIALAMKEHPTRIAGFASVNPWHREEAIAELERAVVQKGLKGLKLHPPTQGFDVGDMELLEPLFDKVAELGIPVTIHCGLRVHDNPWRIGLLAEAYPETIIIMAHSNFGGTDRVGTAWVAKKAKNVVFETSGTSESSFVREIVELTGGARVAYGSDWPYIPPALELAIVEAAGLSAGQLDNVLGENVARLLDL